MKTISQKDLPKKKKPIQIYFEPDMVLSINLQAAKKGIPVTEYIRQAVVKDLDNEQTPTELWIPKRFDLGGPLTNEEMDAIIYEL